jgi:hypothetical protein
MPLELISKSEGRVLKVLHEVNAHIDEIARNTDVRDGSRRSEFSLTKVSTVSVTKSAAIFGRNTPVMR